MGKIFKVNGKFKILPFIGLTILPLIGGGGIGYLIRNSINIYGKLDKPIFSPPSFVFIIVNYVFTYGFCVIWGTI